jgi:TatD DNase family protein
MLCPIYYIYMFDTHCHLNFSQFEIALNRVINEAREANVKKFLIPGTDLLDSKKAIQIAQDFEGVYSAVGLHPTNNLENVVPEEFQDSLLIMAEEKRVVAIGETGLDYYRYLSSPTVQKRIFDVHYKTAKMLGIALVIHSRHATDDVLDKVEEYWDESMRKKIVFHCAEANPKYIDFSQKYGCFIGVDGDVTYDTKKQDFVKSVPLENLVLETDSPNLVPEPLKSKKVYPNEPKYLKFTAECVAKIKNIEIQELMKQTYNNSLILYNIK